MEARQREVLARGHQKGATRWWNQRLHLGGVFGVVHQEQGALVVEDGQILSAEVFFFFGELGFGMESAEDVGHGFGGGEGVFADASEIEIDLGVGIVWCEFGREF
jgi:hypothetical protein